ncbi:MAG: hypothetical protein Q8K85_03525 [Hyphomicrobium sp.]|nr:hypothetical protein [Hyphomicrobium sp.]
MNDAFAASPRKFLRRAFAIAGAVFLALSFCIAEPVVAQTAQKKPADKSAKAAKAKKKEPVPKEVRIWAFNRPNGVPTLVYGLANGDVMITFSCQPETGLMRVVTHIGTRGVKPGDGTPVRLSNGNVRMEFSGTAFAAGQAHDGVDIGGATKIDQKFFALFRAGDTLLLDIPGRKRGLPTKNSQQSVDAFEKACVMK